MALSNENEEPTEIHIESFSGLNHSEGFYKSDESKCIFELERAIEIRTKERNSLREKLRLVLRQSERLDTLLPLKLECKERELRHFLLPSVPRSNTCDVDTNKHQTTSNCAISSNVRPVPTLVSGLTKPVDSLLGPAGAVARTANSKGGALLPTPCSNTSQAGGKSVSHTRGLLSSTIHSQSTIKPSIDNASCIKDFPDYTDVLVDSSVNLVLSRLRRTQCNFDKLVAANQSELQSFTFTQNSQNGKRIMMRIRVLEHENEELANVNRTGRTARLESEISLRRAFVNDLKNAHADMEYLVEEAESETEMLGSSLIMLQQRLQLIQSTAEFLASELEKLEAVNRAEILNSGGDTSKETEANVTNLSPEQFQDSQHDSLYDEEVISDSEMKINRQSSKSPDFYTGVHPVDEDISCFPTEINHHKKSPIYTQVPFISETSISNDENLGKSKRRRVSGNCGNSSNDMKHKSHLDTLSFLPTPLSRHITSSGPSVSSDRTKSRPSIPVRGPQRTFHSNRKHNASDSQIKSISAASLDESVSNKHLKLSNYSSNQLTVDSSIKSCIKSFTSGHPNAIDGSS
ncbi:Pre-mRNA-splicing regulator female-lethal(2)D [Schistosoma japonicum]|nr:Pre-mRNA-splicing regulator female-lethal(2)D [Schistosoma japonicum]